MDTGSHKHVKFPSEPATQQNPGAAGAGHRARKTADPNKPKDPMKKSQSASKPNKPTVNGNSKKPQNQISKGGGQMVVSNPANATRKDTRTKTEGCTKVVEKFNMTTKSVYSDTPGSTTSVSTRVTVIQTRQERPELPTNGKASGIKAGHHPHKNNAQITNGDYKPSRPRAHHEGGSKSIKSNKPSNSNNNSKTNGPATTSSPTGAKESPAERNPKADKSTHASANGTKHAALEKKPKPARQPSHQKASTKPTNKPKTGHPNKPRNPANATTTTKEQISYVHKFDSTTPGSMSNEQQPSENRSMILNSNEHALSALKPPFRPTLISCPTSSTTTTTNALSGLKPPFRPTLVSRPTSSTTTTTNTTTTKPPNQTTYFPNMNFTNSSLSNFGLSQIAQLHHHPPLQQDFAPAKGYVKVHVSKTQTSSHPSK
ncbi:hypothetical protein PGTUg99_020838 [Puccinia graminis f. sp. tritici]|uniref:Uncharacterized protein n=1 Tax=Puccinia graminis f. sp. tritici TaxID=56615 RepID=A0A5B0SJ59_PUCGR|nr:hypothetical protein PGTUg99_020838 [Puccinia graminis f. sp. tritici]